MKKVMFLLVTVVVLGMQLVNAQNTYLHWVYWVNDVNHQVTPTELAEITSDLYGVNGKIIIPNQVYKLSTGITYKIPQPSLFLAYIEKAVQAARPSARKSSDVIAAIKGAEKRRWDNNISIAGVKNYYYSSAHKRVQAIDDYSGEGKAVDFLFIDEKPTFKCDCVNALLNPTSVIITKKDETGDGSLGDFRNLNNDLPADLGGGKTKIDLKKKDDFKPKLPEAARNPSNITAGECILGLAVAGLITTAILEITKSKPHHEEEKKTIPPVVTPGEPGGTPPSYAFKKAQGPKFMEIKILSFRIR